MERLVCEIENCSELPEYVCSCQMTLVCGQHLDDHLASPGIHSFNQFTWDLTSQSAASTTQAYETLRRAAQAAVDEVIQQLSVGPGLGSCLHSSQDDQSLFNNIQ